MKKPNRDFNNRLEFNLVISMDIGNDVLKCPPLVKAIERYKANRINNGDSYLGLDVYDMDENVTTDYNKLLNEFNSIGMIKEIDLERGVIIADCLYDKNIYNPDTHCVTMHINGSKSVKGQSINFYLSRSYMNGISIIDGETSIFGYRFEQYPYMYTCKMVLHNMPGLAKAIENFSKRSHSFDRPCEVKENNKTIGIITNISLKDDASNDTLLVYNITVITKERNIIIENDDGIFVPHICTHTDGITVLNIDLTKEVL